MMTFCCQLPSRLWFFIQTRKLVRTIILILFLFFYCEFFHYYMVLLSCTWPTLQFATMDTTQPEGSEAPLRAMFIADTHILGSKEGHWFDKLRREWQMERSFQASMSIHNPDVVFILGDLLDEGKWCSDREFNFHVQRFQQMFRTPFGTKTHIVVGNHDIGFHYLISEKTHDRFRKAFDAPPVRMLQIKENTFVMLNSMAMEGDGCSLCSEAMNKLTDIKWQLKCAKGREEKKRVADVCDKMETFRYSRPILIQHFPMYRASDSNCSTADAAPLDEKDVPFREKWDCLSQDATNQLFEWINPRLIISAHTHHGCFREHSDGTPEWTVASFSWRNKKNPTFLMGVITSNNFAISQCYLPHEYTVISIYITGAFLIILSLLIPNKYSSKSSKGMVLINKSN
ncbi:hypothetical protein CHS0354_036178 [Potamilus streckersoni]|uniref:Calcineurin-like phosphoesterase domain-containing protein n=1 Tax=Potamilus streckersoni TaxID=2493646 RepID=A0AAE0W2C1_9BIVA|nr:hypothetical protein CHS0354_036178 [Potamilus streckersoni]